MYGGLALSAGDEVLTHHARLLLDRGLACGCSTKRTGAQVQRVTLYDDPWQATVDEMVVAAGRRAHPAHQGRGGDLGALLHGRPAARPGDQRGPRRLTCRAPSALRRRRARLRAVDVDLPDLGCDFLSAGTHKWLFGPRGTGILWGRDWRPLTELIPSFSGPDEGARLTPGGYHAFEHRWALDQAFAFHQRIGRAGRRPAHRRAGHPAQGGAGRRRGASAW